MNHQPYEEWLFDFADDRQALTAQQISSLNEHLQICPSCRKLSDSWLELEAHLQNHAWVAPRPGFTQRWQTRLGVERQKAHRRQTLGILIFTFGGVLVLSTILAYLAWPWLQSPGVLLWVGLYRLWTLYVSLGAFREVLTYLVRSAAGSVPVVWWFIFVGVLCELGVLWIVSIRLLTNPRRVTK